MENIEILNVHIRDKIELGKVCVCIFFIRNIFRSERYAFTFYWRKYPSTFNIYIIIRKMLTENMI